MSGSLQDSLFRCMELDVEEPLSLEPPGKKLKIAHTDGGSAVDTDGGSAVDTDGGWAVERLQQLQTFDVEAFQRVAKKLTHDNGFVVSTDYSGIGAAEEALRQLAIALTMVIGQNSPESQEVKVKLHCERSGDIDMVPSLAKYQEQDIENSMLKSSVK